MAKMTHKEKDALIDSLKARINALEAAAAKKCPPKPQNPNSDSVQQLARKEVIAKVEAFLESIRDEEQEPDKVKAIFRRASKRGVNLKKIGWSFSTATKKFFKIGEAKQERAEQQAAMF